LHLIWSLAVFIASCLLTGGLQAGGGPENVVVLVNGNSDASKRIANFYVALRNIPDANIIILDEVPDTETTDIETFREKILKPAINEINARKLAARVDYLVYSADFPTAIQVQSDLTELKNELPQVITKVASINGLTFLTGLALAKNPSYLSLDANSYTAQPANNVLQYCCPGNSLAEFNAAAEAFAKEDFTAALEKFQLLVQANKLQAALHYWLARCQAKLDDETAALDELELAMRLGWSFRQYTEQDPALENLKESARFQGLLELLVDSKFDLNQSRGFRSSFVWGPNGMRVDSLEHGSRFFLSTVLAVTRGAGLSEDESISMLERAAAADATHPQGTFYFTSTADVRTTTRQPGFAATIAELQRLEFKAEVVEGTLPQNRDDILGLMMGAAQFNWQSSGSKIKPGAICENLTSFGGVMDQLAGQTKLTELLRAGAAGASGTVTEPYAIQAKFPHPSIQVHYARGCSLAESFYQSVSGPYQLLIVGDPLCQPWAVRPEFEFLGLRAGQSVSDAVECSPITENNDANIGYYEIYMDGRFSGPLERLKQLRFDSQQLADGYHELRVIAIAANAIETQSRKIIPFFVNNHEQFIRIKRADDHELDLESNLKLQIESNVDVPVHVMHAGRILATLEKGDGTINLDCRNLGSDTVRLQATAMVDEKPMYSEPLQVVIKRSSE
jgi:uncharacterized protein (TIGR03790 family)